MYEEKLEKMKDFLKSDKDALLNHLRHTDIEAVYNSAFTLITYERIFSLFTEDPDFQTEEIVDLFIKSDGALFNSLVVHCVTNNVINLDLIREICLEQIAIAQKK